MPADNETGRKGFILLLSGKTSGSSRFFSSIAKGFIEFERQKCVLLLFFLSKL
jgi:hypothetical protein